MKSVRKYLISLIILAVAASIFTVLWLITYTNYTSLEVNYATLQNRYQTLQNQYSNLQSQYNNLNNTYSNILTFLGQANISDGTLPPSSLTNT